MNILALIDVNHEIVAFPARLNKCELNQIA